MVSVFVIFIAYLTCSGVRLMPVEEKTVCWPFPPECFQEVGVFFIAESRFDCVETDGVKGGNISFRFVNVG